MTPDAGNIVSLESEFNVCESENSVFGFYFHLLIVLKTKLCFLVALCLISDWRLTEHRHHVAKGHHEVTQSSNSSKKTRAGLAVALAPWTLDLFPLKTMIFFKRRIQNVESFPQTPGYCSF